MKASSGGTGMITQQANMIATLQNAGVDTNIPFGEFDLLAISGNRFGGSAAYSMDSTDQYGGGASCVETLDFETETAWVLDMAEVRQWISDRSHGLFDLSNPVHVARANQFASVSHSSCLNDFTQAARVPLFTTRRALEGIILMNNLHRKEEFHPFVVSHLRPFYLFIGPFICFDLLAALPCLERDLINPNALAHVKKLLLKLYSDVQLKLVSP